MSKGRILKYSSVLALLILSGCILFPLKVYYSSYLLPEQEELKAGYERGDRNTVSYYIEGSRLDVRYMADRELNELFPDDAQGGRLSTNPYTYGDWVDPNLGYTPNRFTVFEVAVYNYTLPKMMLDPTRAVLSTDRGRTLQSYTVSPTADRKSLEGYYRALRRISGNEYYRFAKRIGIVRSTLYGTDEVIFKGEHYSGFIVFEPLDPKVQKVALMLEDFGIEFDAFNRPTQTIDIPFHFERRIELAAARGEEEEERIKTRVEVHGPRDLTGNQPGDLARDIGAINSVVSENLADLNRCFQLAFEKGQALEGEITVEFVILVNGEVTEVRVVESAVSSEAVEECAMGEINGWRFQPAGRFAPEAAPAAEVQPGAPQPRPQPAQQRGLLSAVTVVYPFQFAAAQ